MEVETLEAQIDELRLQVHDTTMKDKLFKVSQELANLTIVHNEHLKDLAALRTKNDSLKDEKTDVLIKMTKLFEEEKGESKALKSTLNGVRLQNKHLKQDNDNLKQKYETQTNALNAAYDQRDEMRTEIHILQDRIENLQLKIEQEKESRRSHTHDSTF